VGLGLATSDRIHRSKIRIKQIVGIKRLAANLGIECQTARRKAAGLDLSISCKARVISGTFMAN
jgi:hypothetical protein